MTKDMVKRLQYRLDHGLTKEEAVKELQEAHPDHPVEVVVYEYRRRGNSMGCQQPIVIRGCTKAKEYWQGGGEEVAPMVSVDVESIDRFTGPRFQPTFSSNYRRSEMVWVIKPGDLVDYRYPSAS